MASSNARAEAGAPALGVSVVTFRSDLGLLRRTLETLRAAVAHAAQRARLGPVTLWLVDNTPGGEGDADALERTAREALPAGAGITLETIRGQGNVGFGRAHNLALARSAGAYHLVLNPDVELAPDSIFEALRFMDANPSTGVLAAHAADEAGRPLYLCKRYPAVIDLLVRGFAPDWIARLCEARLQRYELREVVARGTPTEVPIASGCFMFCRKRVLDALGGFAPQFFLYFEDFDLSLRAAALAKVVYVPAVRIVHHGGFAARKGLRHIGLFCRSALRFYGIHGWKLV
jgi:GT2 family glycosyltransferase